MGYAEVCVNSPVASRHTFSYAIPPGLNVVVGQSVLVPFGQRMLQGVVLELSDHPQVEQTKEIAGILETRPVLSPAQVSLAYWLSQYYLSPLFDAVALMLPPGFERKALTFVAASVPDNYDLSSLSEEQEHVMALIQKEGKIGLKTLEKSLGQKKAQAIVTQLVKRGLVTKSYELERVRAKPRVELYLSLAVVPSEAQQQASNLKKRAKKQAALLDFLACQPNPVLLAEARNKAGGDTVTVKALTRKGLVRVQRIEVRRDPLSSQDLAPTQPLVLTPAQEAAFKAIQSSLLEARKGQAAPAVFLLHGVTGSGKTEVYLQALAEAVRLGKRGIVLVPEIALTPQTIERFASRFPGRVAVLHSRLSLGEQFDEWQRIRNGVCDVVIGPRSALFAPQPDLGLIVIDEEHEWTYKQDEKSPRYHTRDTAIKLAELTGAVVVLGSATPDVETYYRAQRGDYRLLQLPERVTPTPNSPLPDVEVVDLREELKAGNRSLFSRSLSQAITEAVAGREQVILFLNRRGAATFVQCRNCGFVLRCRRCEVSLTYHSVEEKLVCHLCNYKIPVPHVCPKCLSRRIKFLGIGTQKLEEETRLTFPQARLLRWDSDAAKGKHSHQELLNKFRDHQADILIGTQMVTKGLDLPQVTLVGVVNADISLNFPDLRAGERTFQLLSQVAGRAGRGPLGGRVIIQTYSPEHYAVQAAARHDYALFYNKEIAFRRAFHDPPFSHLASLIYTHFNEKHCQQEAERMVRLLIDEKDARGIADLAVLGPAPAFVHRLRGRSRWQLIVRGSGLSEFFAPVPFPTGWTVDIDPVGLV
ncbi:MAG: primosomal protein N' [Chloroflexi bacterium]|nr:primosomal protein N' [Chloroflexota bacterium]